MTLLVKSWGWPNTSQKGHRINATENFNMHLHEGTVKVNKLPIIWEPSLQPYPTMSCMHL